MFTSAFTSVLGITLVDAAVDGLLEEKLGTSQIGTTRKGIGPAYSTRAA